MDVAKQGKKAERKANQHTVPMSGGQLGYGKLAKQTVAQIQQDHVGSFAAALAFRAMFALFPFIILLLTLLGIFGSQQQLTSLVEGEAATALPNQARELIVLQIEQLTAPDVSGLAIGAIISALLALWAVSGGFRAIMESMNVMYGVDEGRGFLRKTLDSIVFSIVAVLLFLVALTLVVAGTDIASFIAGTVNLPEGPFVTAWAILQWPVLIGFVLLAFALIYYAAPNVEQEFRWVSPGSVVGVVAWILFSLAFGWYVNNFADYNATYGAIAGVVVLMLYLYWSSFILLVGAEINEVIEEHDPAGKNKGERRPGERKGGHDRAGARRQQQQ